MKKLKFVLLIFIFIMLLIIFAPPCFAESNLKTYCPSAILIETSTGKILYEKNANEVSYPASTTKIMTAILTVENCNLNDVATVSHNAVYSIPYNYTHASLKEGEELTIEQLLYALMVPSANDAAIVLAEHISGSVEEFAKLMNKKAEELGCKNTNFVNPNGIHNKNHTSTAYDLALIGQYAMKNETIRKIVSTKQFTLPATNKYNKTDRIFNNTNDLLSTYSKYYYKGTTGVKTGYTSEAGNCIVASAKKNGFEVLLVVLGGKSTSKGLSERYLDCKTLFDYAFNNYSIKTLNEKNSILQQVTVHGATKETQVVASGFLPILLRVMLIIVVLYLLFLLLKPSKKKKKKIYKKKSKGGNYKFTQFSNLR